MLKHRKLVLFSCDEMFFLTLEKTHTSTGTAKSASSMQTFLIALAPLNGCRYLYLDSDLNLYFCLAGCSDRLLQTFRHFFSI